jgi:hypothetical protein
MSGWIKLHRKLRDNPIYNESKAVHCWIECLLRANHAGKEVYFKRNKIKLEPGMFLMGRQEFGKSIGISGSTAWYWLLRFEKDKMVDIKKTAKGSIVTIIAWNEYQQVDNRKTTEKQQKNTNKNVKNDKNDKKKKKNNKKKKLPTKEEAKKYFTEYTTKYHKENNPAKYKIDNNKLQLKFTEFWEYWQEREWAGVKNWKLRAGTWVRKMFSNNPNCLKPYKQQKRDSRFVEFKF